MAPAEALDSPSSSPHGAVASHSLSRSHLRSRPVLCIAHRGAASLAPENTLAAARLAWELGADAWEFDVRITKDGVPILMHDATLRRTTDAHRKFPTRGPWWVKSFTLAEIKQLDAGSWFVQVDPFGQLRAGAIPRGVWEGYLGEPVPTLREALQFTRERGWRANIEIKQMLYLKPREIARRIVEVIEELGMEEWVLVSSYDHRVLRQIKRLNPRIATGALVVLRPRNPSSYLERLGADVYTPSLLASDPREFERLRREGFRVYIGPYNDPRRLRELAAHPGVSAILTDFPQRLVPILEELFGPVPAPAPPPAPASAPAPAPASATGTDG